MTDAMPANAEACASGFTSDDSKYPYSGESTADIYAPVYFAVTWVLAAPLRAFGVDEVDAARWIGVVWLALAGVLSYLAMLRLRIPRLLSGALALALIGSPSAFVGSTRVSTDAPTYAIAAALVFALVSFEKRWAAPVLISVAAIGTLTKLQNFAAVAVVAFVLIAQAFGEARATSASDPVVGTRGGWVRAVARNRRFVTAAWMVGGSAVLMLAWYLTRAASAVGTVGDIGDSAPVTASALVTELFRFFGFGGNGPERLASLPAVVVGGSVLLWLWVGGVIGTAAAGERRTVGTTLAVSSLAVAILLGPVLALANVVFSGVYIPLTARYGMSLLPAALVCAGLLLARKRWTVWAGSIAGLVVFAAGLAIPG